MIRAFDKLILKSDLAVIPNVLYLPTKQIFNDLKSRSNKSKYIWHLDLYIYVKDLTNDIWKVSFIFFQFLTCTQRKREFFGTHYEEPELLSYLLLWLCGTQFSILFILTSFKGHDVMQNIIICMYFKDHWQFYIEDNCQ